MNKKKSNDRKLIVREINNAAQLYKEQLVGKKFLYVAISHICFRFFLHSEYGCLDVK